MAYLAINEDGDAVVISRPLNNEELKMAADNTIFVYEFRDGRFFLAEVTEQEPTEEEFEEGPEVESSFDIDWNVVRSIS